MVAGLEIGVVRHFHEQDASVSDETAAAIDAALGVLSGLGARISDVSLPPLADWQACWWIIMLGEAYAVHESSLRTRYDEYGESFRDRCALGAFVSAPDLVHATRMRRALCEALGAALESVDVLVTAVTGGVAPRIDEVPKFLGLDKPTFTPPFNLAGNPALSLCTGFGEGGLPLAMQIAGRPFEDSTALRVGHAYEQATSWRERRPC